MLCLNLCLQEDGFEPMTLALLSGTFSLNVEVMTTGTATLSLQPCLCSHWPVMGLALHTLVNYMTPRSTQNLFRGPYFTTRCFKIYSLVTSQGW